MLQMIYILHGSKLMAYVI